MAPDHDRRGARDGSGKLGACRATVPLRRHGGVGTRSCTRNRMARSGRNGPKRDLTHTGRCVPGRSAGSAWRNGGIDRLAGFDPITRKQGVQLHSQGLPIQVYRRRWNLTAGFFAWWRLDRCCGCRGAGTGNGRHAQHVISWFELGLHLPEGFPGDTLHQVAPHGVTQVALAYHQPEPGLNGPYRIVPLGGRLKIVQYEMLASSNAPKIENGREILGFQQPPGAREAERLLQTARR